MTNFPGATGWLKDPFDGRDHPFTSQVTVKDGTSKDLREDFKDSWNRPYHQGTMYSCVANATAAAYAFELNQARKAGKLTREQVEPSRLFIYYNARSADLADVQESGLVDDGSWPRNAMKSLQVLGVCAEPTWPYWAGPYNPDNDQKVNVDKAFTEKLIKKKTDKVDNYPGPHAYAAAKTHTIVNYERLDVQRAIEDRAAIKQKPDGVQIMEKDGQVVLDNLRQALSEGHPVVFGFFFRWSGLLPLEPGPKGVGKTRQLPLRHSLQDQKDLNGHAVLAVGYDDKEKLILCQNSWGPWAEGGEFFWMRYDWITDFDCTFDFWLMRLVKV